VTGSFVQRQLRASLILPQGVFPGTNSNTLVIDSLRMSARLEQSGNFTNSCDISIYGMRQSDMSAVTTVFVNQNGVPYDPAANAIVQLDVLSPTPGTAAATVFRGQFFEASPDYRAAPDVCLSAQALTGYTAQLTTPAPVSFKGSISALKAAQQITQQMGFKIEANGVDAAVLQAPYLSGSLMEQFTSVAEAAGFDYYFLADGKTVVLCRKNMGRQDKAPVPVNSQTGLVGYPTLQRYGIEIQVLFNTGIELGAPIQVSGSTVPGCDGLWFPFNMTHELETIKPNGKWFSRLACMPFQGSSA
jgi:hypothetical protein